MERWRTFSTADTPAEVDTRSRGIAGDPESQSGP